MDGFIDKSWCAWLSLCICLCFSWDTPVNICRHTTSNMKVRGEMGEYVEETLFGYEPFIAEPKLATVHALQAHTHTLHTDGSLIACAVCVCVSIVEHQADSCCEDCYRGSPWSVGIRFNQAAA